MHLFRLLHILHVVCGTPSLGESMFGHPISNLLGSQCGINIGILTMIVARSIAQQSNATNKLTNQQQDSEWR